MEGSVIVYKHTTSDTKDSLSVLAENSFEVVGLNSKGNTVSVLKKYMKDIHIVSTIRERKRTECKRQVKEVTTNQPNSTPKHRRVGNSKLYLLSLGNNFYKIGYTKSISKRLKTFKTISTFPITVLHETSIPAKKVSAKEAEMKRLFRRKFAQSEGGTEVFKISSKNNALKTFKDCTVSSTRHS